MPPPTRRATRRSVSTAECLLGNPRDRGFPWFSSGKAIDGLGSTVLGERARGRAFPCFGLTNGGMMAEYNGCFFGSTTYS